MHFDDSDKTVADFDIEAFNRQYEAKKEAEEVDNSDQSFEKTDDFEDFDDFDGDLFGDNDLEEELEHSINNESKKSEPSVEQRSKPERGSRRKREQPVAEKTEIFDLNTFNMGEEEAPTASEKTEIFDLNKFNMGGDSEEEEEEVEYARIKILDGADPLEYTLTTDRFTVGRSEENDITISNSTISRTHCEFSYTEEEGFTIKDLNSGNGIKVNGRKVTEKKLKSGCKISIGGIKVQFFDLISDEEDFNRAKPVAYGNASKNKKMILLRYLVSYYLEVLQVL